MKEKFFVLECNGETGFTDVDLHGPFPSEAACTKFILEEAKRVYDIEEGTPQEGRNEEWGSNHIIVREVVTVKPCPNVRTHISMDLITSEQKGKPTYAE
jgi:hypothetical protein